MNNPRWLLTRTATKGLVLLLAFGLFLGACPRAFARHDDLGLLNEQVLKLYQEGKYQEAIPIAEKLLAITRANHIQPKTSVKAFGRQLHNTIRNPFYSRSS